MESFSKRNIFSCAWAGVAWPMSINRLNVRVKIYAEMFFRLVIVNVGIDNDDGIDDVSHAPYGSDVVEIRGLTVYGFKVLETFLADVDAVGIVMPGLVAQQDEESIFWLHIADGQFKTGGG